MNGPKVSQSPFQASTSSLSEEKTKRSIIFVFFYPFIFQHFSPLSKHKQAFPYLPPLNKACFKIPNSQTRNLRTDKHLTDYHWVQLPHLIWGNRPREARGLPMVTLKHKWSSIARTKSHSLSPQILIKPVPFPLHHTLGHREVKWKLKWGSRRKDKSLSDTYYSSGLVGTRGDGWSAGLQ